MMRAELHSHDDSERLVDEVARAYLRRTPLRIRGGDSKAHLGRPVSGIEIDTRSHRGVVSYDPTELVITARAGTPLAELNAVLDAAGQMLPCEPPAFDGAATVGGAVATGVAGPRRPWVGSVRDFVLGCRVITGEAKHLRFGGEVMKNVAGYDMSRLLAGSYGCLGLITEVSFKVLPKPRAQRSLTLELDAGEALRELSAWHKAVLPVSGACYLDGKLHVRLEGGTGSVAAAVDRIGGVDLEMGFWDALREQRLAFFDDPRPLWRLSLPNATPLAASASLSGALLIDWAGAQRWLKSDASAATIRAAAAAAGGHATCFTPLAVDAPFQPLAASLLRFHQQLKQRLDPRGIFNPGRMYADL
jgi:glycolate oxidase FAD binding subunit